MKGRMTKRWFRFFDKKANVSEGDEYHKATMKHEMDLPPITDVSQMILSEDDLKKAKARQNEI